MDSLFGWVSSGLRGSIATALVVAFLWGIVSLAFDPAAIQLLVAFIGGDASASRSRATPGQTIGRSRGSDHCGLSHRASGAPRENSSCAAAGHVAGPVGRSLRVLPGAVKLRIGLRAS